LRKIEIGKRYVIHDRYRLGSANVIGIARKLSSTNDGVMLELPEGTNLGPKAANDEIWVRAYQLQPYTGTDNLNFGDVMDGIKWGKAFARKGWNGRGIFIVGQFPDEHSKMTQPYIYIVTLDLMSTNPDAVRGQVPWLASQTDMFAEDWVEM
jgi:hypothetical protein